MILTLEWQEYDQDYQKLVQDIRTKDGKEHLDCWPNAGNWHVMNSVGYQIADSEVTHVRLAHSEYGEQKPGA